MAKNLILPILFSLLITGCFKSGNTIHLVSDKVKGPHFVYPVDLDLDGDIDVLSAGYLDGKIYWHENMGNCRFKDHIIISQQGKATCVVASDIDNDGDIDIVSTSKTKHNVIWYENLGEQRFRLHILSKNIINAYKVFVIDIDRDGYKDIVTASYAKDGNIDIFYNNRAQTFVHKTIAITHGSTSTILPLDMDKDGNIDILSSSVPRGKISWHRNMGNHSFASKTLIYFPSIFAIDAADVDGDGDIDIVGASYSIRHSGIKWFENDGSFHFKEHVIDTPWSPVPSLFAADVDGDHDMDIIAALKNHNSIIWYENDGKQNFTFHILTTSTKGVFNIAPADMDNDGKLDVVAASYFGNTVSWHKIAK